MREGGERGRGGVSKGKGSYIYGAGIWEGGELNVWGGFWQGGTDLRRGL